MQIHGKIRISAPKKTFRREPFQLPIAIAIARTPHAIDGQCGSHPSDASRRRDQTQQALASPTRCIEIWSGFLHGFLTLIAGTLRLSRGQHQPKVQIRLVQAQLSQCKLQGVFFSKSRGWASTMYAKFQNPPYATIRKLYTKPLAWL